MDRDVSISGKQFIESLYMAMFGRQADTAGLLSHRRELARHADPLVTIQAFLASAEFRALAGEKYGSQRMPHDLAPGNPIELGLSAEQMSALWRHVEGLWSSLGIEDPYWSVMTDDSFRLSKMSAEETLRAFYDTGRGEVKRLRHWLDRNGLTLKPTSTCAEYGCGVGRLSYWLAELCSQVNGFDISQPHLDAAQRWMSSRGRSNVSFRKVSGRTDLSALRGADLFYSVIVLQHNPPPIIQEVLAHALEGLNSGGIAFFQVPTYFLGYSFAFRQYIDTPPPPNKVEMHCLPQREVFRLARDHGCDVLEVQPDHMTGSPHVFTSNTFLLRKR